MRLIDNLVKAWHSGDMKSHFLPNVVAALLIAGFLSGIVVLGKLAATEPILTATPVPPDKAEVMPVPEHCYYGRVSAVTDGDTLKVDVFMEGRAGLFDQEIRLLDVFSVEKREPGGTKSKAQLLKLLPVGTPVVVKFDHVRMRDNKLYSNNDNTLGRLLAQVWRRKDGTDINFAMAKWLVVHDLWGGTGTKTSQNP